MSDTQTAEELLTRPRCVLLGCELEGPCCHYCGEDLYEGFIQYGKLDPLFRLYRRVRRALRKLGPKRCAQCGKRFMCGYDDDLCSDECHDQWLPF